MELTMHRKGRLQAMLCPPGKPRDNRAHQSANQTRANRYQALDYGIPSIHKFTVISDNPNFSPEWVRIGRSAGDSYVRTTSWRSAPVISGALGTELVRCFY